MGNYNPSQPEILGEEWVPIREEDLVFNQVVNNVEFGTTMSLQTAITAPYSGRFYLNKLPDSLVRNQVWTMAVYERGEEAESGPVQRVVIPVANGGITGSSGGISLVNAADVQTALFDPSDRRYIRINLGSFAIDLGLYFDVARYAQMLNGKRILGVNFLYGGELITQGDESGQTESMNFTLRNNAGTDVINYPSIMTGTNPFSGSVTPFRNKEITRIALGDTNMFFNPSDGVNITEAIPWDFNGLLRFDSTNASPVQFHFRALGVFIGAFGPNWTMDYAGLEVIYCEEKRIAVGSAVFQYGAAATTRNYQLGLNNINFYGPGGTAAPSLNGVNKDYTITLAQGSLGDSPLFFSLQPIGAQPQVNALRELYQVEPQIGKQVNIPAPPTEEIVGEVMSVEDTPILVQLSLHNDTFSTTYTPTHSYGRQSVAQVYGSKTASQRIDDSQVASASYNNVRFYARRFGNTVVPLTLSGASTSTFINPSDFDNLDPIIDGWKEISLVLDPPAVMGGTGSPTFTWTATQETAGNRWEVLGAVALSQDGIPGQPLTQTTNLSVTTYGGPISGGTIYETWMPQSLPPVSGTTADSTADAALFFSFVTPAPTGVSVFTATQPLSGIGLNCGVAPEFIPTALQYNRVQWQPNPAFYVHDTFNRTGATWGTANTGQNWSSSTSFGTSPGFGYGTGVAAGIGPFGPDLNSTRFVAYDTIGYVEIASTVAPSGAANGAGISMRGRVTPSVNEIDLLLYFNLDSTVSFGVYEITQGTGGSQFSTGPQIRSYVLGSKVSMRWSFIGQHLLARMWVTGTEEPDDWQLQYSIYGPNSFDSRIFGASLNWSAGASATLFQWSNLLLANATNGYMELQRRDEITDWQTIMKGTWMATSGFNDYEARIGLQSDYRIRYVNKYGFEGPWSSTVSNTIPAPGVTATSLDADDQVFVFTTNEHQDGSSNLAYSPAWTGQVQEDFNFPESSGQVYQTMYGRDYVTVFRPEERGGVNFTRNILVQAAAISPPTLEDFTSLRDMAWADVSYICVRDAEGNRWFANVSVPSGSVVHYRKLYMAPFNVVQVTDTPSPVDPSWLD